MAYSISNRCENKAVKIIIDVLLSVTATESYPNGNSGYNQSATHSHERNLAPFGAPFGVRLQKVYGGDAHTMGVYRFVADKHITHKNLRAIRAYVLNEVANIIGVKKSWQYKLNSILRTDLFSNHVDCDKQIYSTPITFNDGFVFNYSSERLINDKDYQQQLKSVIKNLI